MRIYSIAFACTHARLFSVPEMFAREDKNKDGVLSWEEFGGPKGKYPPKVTYAKKDEKKEL